MLKDCKKYSVEERVAGRIWILRVNEKNSKDETMLMEISRTENYEKNKHGIAYVWKRAGFTKTVYKEWWTIETQVEDPDGNCYGRYNPQHKISEDDKRLVINFDYLFDGCSEENLEILVNEALKRFFAA